MKHFSTLSGLWNCYSSPPSFILLAWHYHGFLLYVSINLSSVLPCNNHTIHKDKWYGMIEYVSIRFSSVLPCNYIDHKDTWLLHGLIVCVSINLYFVLLLNHIVHKRTWHLHGLFVYVSIISLLIYLVITLFTRIIDTLMGWYNVC